MHSNILNFTWLCFVFRQSQFHDKSKTLTGVVEDRATQRILLQDVATNLKKNSHFSKISLCCFPKY